MYATKTHPPILGLVAVGRFRNFIFYYFILCYFLLCVLLCFRFARKASYVERKAA